MWGERERTTLTEVEPQKMKERKSEKSRQRDRRIPRATLWGVQPQTKPEKDMM